MHQVLCTRQWTIAATGSYREGPCQPASLDHVREHWSQKHASPYLDPPGEWRWSTHLVYRQWGAVVLLPKDIRRAKTQKDSAFRCRWESYPSAPKRHGPFGQRTRRARETPVNGQALSDQCQRPLVSTGVSTLSWRSFEQHAASGFRRRLLATRPVRY